MSADATPPDAGAMLGPSAVVFSSTLSQSLAHALAAKGADYQPRTRHLDTAGRPLYTNRLLLEASPYLQQHAHNPVNWFPWGDEAFALAKDLGRPVLLSVGYATCHWCHVMEEESFEDPAIAEFINANYIAVKVDREERLDVDSVYMACVQAWSGQGGWPMTVWLTPERRPYFGGTYFPPRDGARGARIGFLTLLGELRRTYDEQPERVEEAATRVLAHLQAQQKASTAPAGLTEREMTEILAQAYRYYERGFDAVNGGLGGAPKFPSSLPLRFLLRYGERYGEEARAMCELTLTQMAAGGLQDQIGGGFHRYTVDGVWLVPHFEKMLYDNALLADAYLEAWQLSGRADFAAVVTRTLDYVRLEMTAPGGGFYAATDADSANPERGGEREEGWFFTWTPAELEALLPAELARLAVAYYAVTPEGNFEGRSILHTPKALAAVAAELGVSLDAAAQQLAQVRTVLYTARARRPPPLCDDKVITSWNALMISALARAGLALRRADYTEAAAAAATFVTTQLFDGTRLARCFKDGPSRTRGFLEDYTFLVQALLDLYEASFASHWLSTALRLAALCEELFAAPDGGYFLTPEDGEALLLRERPSYDGAVPSGSSVHALNLLRLAALTEDAAYQRRAEAVLASAAPVLKRTPAALGTMLLAVDFALARPRQIAVIAPQPGAAEALLAALGSRFLPHRVLAGGDARACAEASSLVPMLKGKQARDGRATAYICQDHTCQLPVQDGPALLQQLS